jgi:glycosyltransferase
MCNLPKIAIITSVLNGAAHLEKAILSVLQQTYPNLVYIIMDANSSDGTQAIVKKYQDRIHYHRQADLGAADAYNIAIKATDADIIGMLSADDWLEPDILTAVGHAFAQHPAAEIVSTETRLVREDGSSKYFPHRALDFNFKAILAWPLTNARFYRKRLFEKYGYFVARDHNNAYNIPADTELLLKFALHPIINIRLPQLGYTFLCHENSLTSSTDQRKKIHIAFQLMAIYQQLFQTQTLTRQQKHLLARYHTRAVFSIILRSLKLRSFTNLKRALKQTNIGAIFCL